MGSITAIFEECGINEDMPTSPYLDYLECPSLPQEELYISKNSLFKSEESSAETNLLFNTIDFDNDHYITETEFLSVYQNPLESVERNGKTFFCVDHDAFDELIRTDKNEHFQIQSISFSFWKRFGEQIQLSFHNMNPKHYGPENPLDYIYIKDSCETPFTSKSSSGSQSPSPEITPEEVSEWDDEKLLELYPVTELTKTNPPPSSWLELGKEDRKAYLEFQEYLDEAGKDVSYLDIIAFQLQHPKFMRIGPMMPECIVNPEACTLDAPEK